MRCSKLHCCCYFESHFWDPSKCRKQWKNLSISSTAPISILIDTAEHKHNSSIAAQKQEASDPHTLIHSQKWEASIKKNCIVWVSNDSLTPNIIQMVYF